MTQEAGTPPGFWERIEKMIEAGVAKAMRSGPLRNATISGGSGLTISGGGDLNVGGGGDLTISDGGNLTVDGGRFFTKYSAELGGGDSVYIGDMYNGVGGPYLGSGLLVQAPDGTDLAMFRYDEAFGRTRWDLYDSGNRVIVGNDASSGQGLARPWLDDGAPRLTRYVDWPTFTLAATSAWETVYAWSHVKQHPRLEVCVYASMDTAATTGEMRVMVGGVQLGSTASLTFTQGPNFFGPANVAGAHMSVLDVQVQIQRTTATGGIKLAPAFCRGRQSP